MNGVKSKHFFENGAEVDVSSLGKADVEAGSEDIISAISLAGKDQCIRLFIAGAVTHVGKTTICLGILGALRKAGIAAADLAYIKPATQCEAPDLLEAWCKAEGVVNISGENAPLVFYSGFTRSFLNGEQGTSADWIAKITTAVDELSVGRRVVVVDGVGFPAVGSIVGVDNAEVAKACRAPVLMVCKAGVGGAIDSFSLNSCYFTSKGVPVLGAIFNLAENDGFYSWDKCAESIKKWFDQGARRECFYGVVPKAEVLLGLREKVSETDQEALLEFAQLNVSHLANYVDLVAILTAAATDPWCRRAAPKSFIPKPAISEEFKPKSRNEVASVAQSSGAKGGG